MHVDKDGKPHPDCGAVEATHNLNAIMQPKTSVTLTFDPVSDRTDRYDRSLAYVANSAGRDAGRQQIINGYAEPWYPTSARQPARVNAYLHDENEAKQHHAGAWSWCRTLGRR